MRRDYAEDNLAWLSHCTRQTDCLAHANQTQSSDDYASRLQTSVLRFHKNAITTPLCFCQIKPLCLCQIEKLTRIHNTISSPTLGLRHSPSATALKNAFTPACIVQRCVPTSIPRHIAMSCHPTELQFDVPWCPLCRRRQSVRRVHRIVTDNHLVNLDVKNFLHQLYPMVRTRFSASRCFFFSSLRPNVQGTTGSRQGQH